MEPERTVSRTKYGNGDFSVLKRGKRTHSEAPWMTEASSFVMIVAGGALTFTENSNLVFGGRILMALGFIFFMHTQNLLPLPFGL
jgi:hypothetical protein